MAAVAAALSPNAHGDRVISAPRSGPSPATAAPGLTMPPASPPNCGVHVGPRNSQAHMRPLRGELVISTLVHCALALI